MVGWAEAGMEVVIGMHAGESQKGLVAYREMPGHFLSER